MILFDRQFKILLDDIKILVSDNKEALEKVNYSLNQYSLKNLLPDDYIVSLFNTYINIPYGDHILKKDETFFINENYVNNDYDKDNNNTIILLNSVFKQIWLNKIDDETKNKLWTRMQILVKLCNKWKEESKK